MKDVNIIHKINRTDFAKLFKSKGYVFFDKGEYNLNIIGIRKSGNLITNGFDRFQYFQLTELQFSKRVTHFVSSLLSSADNSS